MRRTPEQPPARTVAVDEMRLSGEGFADLPLGGHAGEVLPAAAPAPVAPVPQPLVIEPPEWEGDPGDAVIEPAAPPALSALDVLRIQADDVEEPGPPAPVMVTPPLVRVALPEPDWRAEEAEQAARERKPAPAELEPPGWLQPRPAKPTPKPTPARPTPNVDRVKEMLREDQP
jgi:hypothetical protein